MVRHGESVGNAEQRLQGHHDYPLSERGRDQVIALAGRFKAQAVTFDHVIASPLSRALETARIIAAEVGAPDPEIDLRWIERDAGELTDTPHTGAPQQRDRSSDAPVTSNTAARQGESTEALHLRGSRALRSILERPPARYLVSSHRAILDTVFHTILGIPLPSGDTGGRTLFRLANGSFSRFRYYPSTGRWQVDVIGDRSHWTRDA